MSWQFRRKMQLPFYNLHTGKALWDGVTQGYQDAASQGDYSKFAGRLVVDVNR